MAKFRKPSEYTQSPSETTMAGPQEHPELQQSAEDVVLPEPSETPAVRPREVCGINGCATSYESRVLMQRHRERQHGIGGAPNLNQPKARNANIKLA